MRPTGHEGINECEHRGDEITRTILQRLNSTFVTPFDREDIHALAESFDDVVDDIQTVSQLMLLTQVTTTLPEMREQADLLVRMAEEAEALINRLESMKGCSPTSTPSTPRRAKATPCTGGSWPTSTAASSTPSRCSAGRASSRPSKGALNTIEDISDVVESIVLKHA